MRLRAWLPLLSLLAAVAVALLAAVWIDKSDLRQPADSWGYAAGVFILTFLYVSLPFAVVVACTLTGVLSRDRKRAHRATVVGAVVAGLVALGGLVLGILVVVDAQRPADTVFGAAVLVAGLVGLLPLPVAVRRPAAT